MNAPVFPIVHSLLSNEALGREIGERYALGGEVQCELLTRGTTDYYVIRVGEKRWAARVWRAHSRSDDDVAYEMTLLTFLHENGIPVVPPIAAKDGSLSFSVMAPEGKRPICLFGWSEGQSFCNEATPAGARQIGAIMARLHGVTRRFKPRSSKRIDYQSWIADDYPSLDVRIRNRPEDRRLYRQVRDGIIDRLMAIEPDSIPRWTIHGDIHARNVMYSKQGGLKIIDFDTCGEAPLMQDVASFLWANSILSLDPALGALKHGIGEAFLEGYESMRPLEPKERALMPLFIAAKEFHFLCGISAIVNVSGPLGSRYASFDWFAESIRKNAAAAGVI